MNKVHENIVLKLAAIIYIGKFKDVIELGQLLLDEIGDELADGGFWIWDFNSDDEFYSPQFRKSLGFEGEHDFPSKSTSWMNAIDEQDKERAFKNLDKNINNEGAYYQIVTYTKKNGDPLTLLCSGSLMRDTKGKPLYLFGTHKLDF